MDDDHAAELEALNRLRRGDKAKARRTAANPGFGSGRDPVPVGEVMADLFQAEGWTANAQLGDLVARWDQIVGHQLSEHCRPVGFDQGTLTLQADSSTWAAQVRLLLPQLQAKVVGAIGQGLVEQIAVKGPTAPRRSQGRWSVKRPEGPSRPV